jgi:hypothetical protein
VTGGLLCTILGLVLVTYRPEDCRLHSAPGHRKKCLRGRRNMVDDYNHGVLCSIPLPQQAKPEQMITLLQRLLYSKSPLSTLLLYTNNLYTSLCWLAGEVRGGPPLAQKHLVRGP